MIQIWKNLKAQESPQNTKESLQEQQDINQITLHTVQEKYAPKEL